VGNVESVGVWVIGEVLGPTNNPVELTHPLGAKPESLADKAHLGFLVFAAQVFRVLDNPHSIPAARPAAASFVFLHLFVPNCC